MSKAQIGKPAPDIETLAWENGVKHISLSAFKGKWVLLFFYPFDFTFVCPTEIISFNDSADTFRKMNTEVLGCSCDSQFVHAEWCKKPRKEGGLGNMTIPLLADVSKQIATDYGVLVQDGEAKGAAYRGTFIIDPQGIVRHISINDLPVGRNIDEYVRLVQAFQFVEEHGEVCPAKWKPGAKTIVPEVNASKNKDYWENEHAKK